MSQQGAFWVDRAIWDHPVLKSRRPFTKLEVWLWLISEAAWKPHRKAIAGKEFTLQRGQLAHSLRFMALAWRWHRNKVCRFLNTLEMATMIGTDAKDGLTIITISKYEEYQRRGSAPDNEIGTPIGTRSGQHRDKPNKKDSSLNREESFRKKGRNARMRATPPVEIFKNGTEHGEHRQRRKQNGLMRAIEEAEDRAAMAAPPNPPPNGSVPTRRCE